MYPIFHRAIPLLLFELPYIKKNFKVNRFALIIGSMFPDFFDKILEFLGLGSGKGIFHTVLFAVIAFLIIFAATKRNLSISIPFLIGILFHLPLDEPLVPYFWPLYPTEFVEMSEQPLQLWLITLLLYLIVPITEIIGGLILLVIIVHYKLYSISKLTAYLKTNQIIQDVKERSSKDKERENIGKNIILVSVYFSCVILLILFQILSH